MLSHAELASLLILLWSFLCLFPGQDVMYQSMQGVVDVFREAVGIPLEKKYNTVLFGGMLDSSLVL